jgi:hypothetical protein
MNQAESCAAIELFAQQHDSLNKLQPTTINCQPHCRGIRVSLKKRMQPFARPSLDQLSIIT